MKEKKSNKKQMTGGIILVAVIVLFAVFYAVFSQKGAAGAKSIIIEVVDDEGNKTSYDVKTDAEYLRGAMDDADGLTYDGTETDNGLMVETVNGLYADYVNDGAYWSILVDGEDGQYGVDQQPVEDGVTYQFVYSIVE